MFLLILGEKADKRIFFFTKLFNFVFIVLFLIFSGIGCGSSSKKFPYVDPNEPVVAKINLIAKPTSIEATGEGISKIVAQVMDENNRAVPDNIEVAFTIVAGSYKSGFIQPVARTIDGIATATYTSGTSVGIVTIKATCGNVYSVVNLNLEPPEAFKVSNIVLSADQYSLPADGISELVLNATVNTEDGKTIPDDIQVDFQVLEGGGTFKESSTSTTISNTIGGKAFATLISDTEIGTATVQASLYGYYDEVKIEYTAGSVKLSVSQKSLLGTGDGKSEVSATIRDMEGKPPINDQNNKIIFSLSDGSFGDLLDPLTDKISDSLLVDHFGGDATVIFLAGTKEGVVNIIAEWNNMKDTITVEVLPSPLYIQIADGYPQPESINVKGTGNVATSLIVFNVIDGKGDPVPNGYRIDFYIETGPNGRETINPLSGITEGGQVRTILRSGFKSGPVSIKATYYNDTKITTTISSIAISAGPPVGEEFAIAPEFRNISGLFIYFLENGITVGAGDIYGNSIPDKTVISFKTYNTGGSFKNGSALTYDGKCSDVLRSQSPDPLEGILSVTAEANNGGRTTRVTSIAVSPHPDSYIIYVGTNGGGVYKSTDSGTSWKNISRSSKASEQGQNWIDPYVNDLCVDPDNHNVIYAATGYLGKGNLFRSLDGGSNWNSNDSEEWNGIFYTSNAVLTVLCDGDGSFNTDNPYPYVWIGTEGIGALYSTDGKHFKWGGTIEPDGTTIISGDTLSNPFNTGNGSLIIHELSNTLDEERFTVTYTCIEAVSSLAKLNTSGSGSEADGTMVPSQPMAESNAGNQAWTVRYIGGFDPENNPDDLILPGGELKLISTSGVTKDALWTIIYKNDPNSLTRGFFSVIATDPTGEETRYPAYTDLNMEYTSTDEEVSFSILQIDTFNDGDKFTFKTLQDAWEVTANGTVMNNKARTGEKYFSDNLEVSFTIESGTKFYKYGDTWTFNTRVSNRWVVEGSSLGSFGYADTGVPYATRNNGLIFTIYNGSIDFQTGDTFWFISKGSGLGYGAYVYDIEKVPGTHGENAILYAGTKVGVFKSTNGGARWNKLSSFAGNNISRIKLHPTKSNGENDIIYVGTNDAGIWVSLDSGNTWNKRSNGMGKGLSATIPVGAQGNKGNGVISEVKVSPDVKTEKWTVTCKGTIKDGGKFSVSGTISGDQADADVGVKYTSDNGAISFIISDGTFDFEAGDTFSFNTTMDPGTQIKDILVDHSNNKIYSITYFWGYYEPHAIGNVYVNDLDPVTGDISSEDWKEVTEGLPQYDPPDDKMLFAQHTFGMAADKDDPGKPAFLYIGGEGINLYRAQNDLIAGNPVWYESKSGLTNIIMARRPILFTDQCYMDVSPPKLLGVYYDTNDVMVKKLQFTVYIQDINGNPPIEGSIFDVTKRIDTQIIEEVHHEEYPDCYIYQGTFRDPGDHYTNYPYIIEVDLKPSEKVVFEFIPTNLSVSPGSSGGERKEIRCY